MNPKCWAGCSWKRHFAQVVLSDYSLYRAMGNSKVETSECTVAENQLGEWKLFPALSLLWLCRHEPTGPIFFPAISPSMKAKEYIKVQIACICLWLWESPTRPLFFYAGFYVASLHIQTHRLTIYAVDDSSPWSFARAQWRQASRATAAQLAHHQNLRKISLGWWLGASYSVLHQSTRKHLEDCDI